MFEDLKFSFSVDEIFRSIKQLKTNKSGGPDRIINEFFIHGTHFYAPTLCNLFNKILKKGIFLKIGLKGMSFCSIQSVA